LRVARIAIPSALLDCRNPIGRPEMSYVIVRPDVIETAATDLAGLGTRLTAANTAAATPTTGVLAAADDEV
jgi:hypothetical protein